LASSLEEDSEGTAFKRSTSLSSNKDIPINEKSLSPILPNKCDRIVHSFSLFTSWKILFTDPNPVDKNLDVLHGVRVLLALWVILGHTYSIFTPYINVEYA